MRSKSPSSSSTSPAERTLRLTVAYDGTAFGGWQVQPGRPTIQAELQAAFGRVLRDPVTVVGSGRTDAGVHALGQVAHLVTRSPLPLDRVLRSVNALLPPTISVMDLRQAARGFHARFSARSKRYRYLMLTAPVVSPFERPYVWHLPIRLDVALMRREAAALRGRHDLRAFHKTGRPVADTVRRVDDVSVRTGVGGLVEIEVEAEGFLYAMMRGIVGTLVDVGRGQRPPGTIAAILKSRDRRLVGPSAPPHGLCLVRVGY